jgi:glycine C-acetyltransferase
MIREKTQFLTDELEQMKERGLFRPLRVLATPQDAEVVVDGQRVLNLSSNNYLGLTTHPRLKDAMISATQEWGAGAGAVRTIAGTLAIHEELERRLAEFKHT